jgi:phenylacetate-CoA ligase
MRYGEAYAGFRGLIVRGRTDPEFVEQFQTSKLRGILLSGYEKSSYVRTVLGPIGGREAAESFTAADLVHLPVLSRARIRENPEEFLVAPLDRVDIRHTSGSSDRPLRVYLDKDRSVRELAFVHDLWSTLGYTIGDRLLMVRDNVSYRFTDKSPFEYDKALGELRLAPSHMTPANMDRYLELIDDWAPRLVCGLPSAIAMLAGHAQRRKWQAPASISGVVTTSETLFGHQRASIAAVFKCRISTYYGLTERTAFAAEIAPDVFAFAPLYGVTELLDANGQPVTNKGARGQIVTTGFLSSAMALLRYETGDRATLVEAPSRVNGWQLIVANIRSKWSQEFVIGREGNPFSVINLVFPSHSQLIESFQFYQDTPGEVVFKVVPGAGVDQTQILPLVKEMQADIGNVLRIHLELVGSIAVKNGKRRLVDQRLAVPAEVLTEI